ncbi:Hypothetical predicted protein [Olea europaea subsp. europaea]|uniref:Uncharacterized protein n=1 Tax=Olea europaea subsp. europaea TaxID=158383 RepID=A0A8S0Q7U2_OLEEU|nr:Hypothetical predicted protein [Olea europaea subsp. europaea]
MCPPPLLPDDPEMIRRRSHGIEGSLHGILLAIADARELVNGGGYHDGKRRPDGQEEESLLHVDGGEVGSRDGEKGATVRKREVSTNMLVLKRESSSRKVVVD